MTESTDIWQEGADPRECEDCGHTSHSCTCYDLDQKMIECSHCGEFIKVAIADEWNNLNFCPDDCLQIFLNE